MRNLLVVLLICLPLSSLAQAKKACWKSEYNPLTNQIYDSESIYQEHVDDWKEIQPASANPLKLMTAYNVYKSEKEKSLSLGNDKVAHCYIGCRVNQKTDFRTVEYMGWYKEMQDITDCKLDTHFEEKDFLATLSGAESQAISATECVNFCKTNWD